MMIRKMLVGGAFAIGLLAGPAAAQESPASVLPSVVERPTPAPATQVKGVQLPRTGGDIDAEVLGGIGLTAAGLALAVAARQRRQRFAANT